MTTPSIPHKCCTKCHIDKPLSEFNKDKYKKSGLVSQCKDCRNQYYVADRERILQQQQEYQQSNRERIREYHREYYQANRERLREQHREWEQANRERKRELNKQYRKANREQIREYEREYSKSNRERIREQKREYRQNNPHVARAATHRYYARKRGLSDTFTAEQWQYALDYFNGCCAVCGRQLQDLFGTHTAAMDHWIPLSHEDCPGTVAENIVPLCHGMDGCNQSKRDKSAEEWLVDKFGTRKAKQIMTRIEQYFDSLMV